MKSLLDNIQKFFVGPHGGTATEEIPPTPTTEDDPMITEKEIHLVQSTWEAVTPIADQAATIFYDKLFELDGELRSLFPEDLSDQKKKLMQMITVAVKGLTKLEEIVPAVQALGKRHVGYGVKDEHYETVGTALILTLGAGLQDAFTDEVKDAWIKVYGILSSTMIEASKE